MRTRSLRRPVLAVVVAATFAAGSAAWAQDGTLPFTIDTARLADDRRDVVVRGTYRCPTLEIDGGVATIDLTVNQAGVVGHGFATIEVCDGRTRSWRARVTAAAGRFRRGPAQVLASGILTGVTPAGEPVTLQVAILSPGQPITITRR
jgi:Family of unknown function (DUF6299)